MLSDVMRYKERWRKSERRRGSVSFQRASLPDSLLSLSLCSHNNKIHCDIASGPKRKPNGHDNRKLTGKFALCIGPKTSQPHDTWQHKMLLPNSQFNNSLVDNKCKTNFCAICKYFFLFIVAAPATTKVDRIVCSEIPCIGSERDTEFAVLLPA